MKKIVMVVVLATILSTGTVFADHPDGLGIGAVGGYRGSWGGGGGAGLSLSLKVPQFPIFWAINLDINDNYFGLGLSGDKYIIDSALVNNIGLHWYLGLGGWVNLGLADDPVIAFGARVPIGLSWQPISLLEIFLEIAPSLGVAVTPNFHFPAGGWPVGLGIRLWI